MHAESVQRGLIAAGSGAGIALGAGLALFGGLTMRWLMLVLGVTVFVASFGFWGGYSSRSDKKRNAWTWSDANHVRSMLALFVVVGGGATIVAVRFRMQDEIGSGFITAVITLMSGVLGWYFGNKGVETAEERVKEVQEETRDALVASKMIKQHAPKIERSAKAYETILRALEDKEELRGKVAKAIDDYETNLQLQRKGNNPGDASGGP